MSDWNQPLTVAAQGLNPDIGAGFGLAPGLYEVQIIKGEVEPAKKQGAAPNLKLTVKTTGTQVGEGCSPAGSEDTLYVSTDTQDEMVRRNQKALALSVGYSSQEVEQPTFQLLPPRVIGQKAIVFAQRNGVSDKGYPNVNRNFVTRERMAKLSAEIKAAGGKVPMGPLGENGRKDGGIGGASNVPGIPQGGAPNFGAGAPGTAGFGAAPAPSFGAPVGFGAPQAAPTGFGTPAPTNGAPPAGFTAPNLDALKM